jgi:hypothetical protein
MSRTLVEPDWAEREGGGLGTPAEAVEEHLQCQDNLFSTVVLLYI